MKYCCVPGCRSKASNWCKEYFFHNIPSDRKNGAVDPLKKKRRLEWIKALRVTKLPESTLRNLTVCSNHFVTGRPARIGHISHRDWVPSLNMPRAVLSEQNDSVDNIIKSLPEVIVKFDIPDYIILDKVKFNETQIEMDLIKKYITNPVCDENGYYNNDHDYLGLPVLPTKTEIPPNDLNKEHNYSFAGRPPCFHFDSRHFCNICACNCVNLFTFNNHMMGHTLRNDVRCGICRQSFLTTTCLNTHLTTHMNLCDVCGNEVPTMQLKAHQWVNDKQKAENEDMVKYKVPFRKKIYFCISCMKKFYSPMQYTCHLSMHKHSVEESL